MQPKDALVLQHVQFAPGQGEQGQVLPGQQPLSIDQAVERLAGPPAASSAFVPPPATQDAVLNAFEQAFISGQVRCPTSSEPESSLK